MTFYFNLFLRLLIFSKEIVKGFNIGIKSKEIISITNPMKMFPKLIIEYCEL